MSPSEAERIVRLEAEVGAIRAELAAVRERVNNVEELIRAFAPITPEVATIRAEVGHLKAQVTELHDDLDHLVKAIEQREKDRRLEGAVERRWRTGLVVTLGLTVVLGLAGLIVQIILASGT